MGNVVMKVNGNINIFHQMYKINSYGNGNVEKRNEILKQQKRGRKSGRKILTQLKQFIINDCVTYG